MDDRRRKQVLDRVHSQMRRAALILVSGAGFSLGARSRSGDFVPESGKLKEALWQVARPDQPLDTDSSLGDVFRVAQRSSGTLTRRLLERSFLVDADSLPEWYRLWFSVPWQRHYTLNIDDLDEAINRRFVLPRELQSLSAASQPATPTGDRLESVHLNGRVVDYPAVTFSPLDYGLSLGLDKSHYDRLVADIIDNGVVFVGTVLEEPNLWRYLEIRRLSGPTKPDFRPGSYLVTPSLPPARAALLEEFNIDHLAMTAEEFADEILESLTLAAQAGHATLERLQRVGAGDQPSTLLNVSELRRSRRRDLTEYLLGRTPDWHDLVEGYAVVRRFEHDLFGQVDSAAGKLAILTGTAGTGKTTTLMRLALQYEAAGKDTRWLNINSGDSLAAIKRAVKRSETEVLCIDDAGRFGRALAGLLIDLSSAGYRVIASARSTGYVRTRLEDDLREANTSFLNVPVPHLEDSDVDLLVNALSRAQRLGALKGKSPSARRRAFTQRAGRQLLVAMIETTSGKRFDEKIVSECSDLDSIAQGVYCVVSVATARGLSLRRQEVLVAAQQLSPEAPAALSQLERQNLIVSGDGFVRSRHRVIAERAVAFFRTEGLIAKPVAALLWGLAINLHPATLRRSREMRLFVDLINHRTLMEIADSRGMPRLVYEDLQDVLAEQYHYWLQRGNYELEEGNLELAGLHLESAKGVGWDDPLVQTSWAHKELRQAAAAPANLTSVGRADEAVIVLRNVIGERGDRDTYPYHVLGAQGLHWGRRAPMTHEQSIALFCEAECLGIRRCCPAPAG